MPFPLGAGALGLSMLVAASGSPSAAGPPKPAPVIKTDLLKVGTPVERNLSGGEIHSYRIWLKPDQYVRFVVEQKGVDVILTLFAPGRKKLMEVDNPNGAQLPEMASLITSVSGNYVLQVRAHHRDIADGLYVVKVEELHRATPLDGRRIEAEKAFVAAEKSRAQVDVASMRSAIKDYERARDLWSKTKDLAYEAEAIVSIADMHLLIDQLPKALEEYNRVLPIMQSTGSVRGEARTLTAMGETYDPLGERQKALEHYEKALPLWRKAGYRAGIAVTLNDSGVVYDLLGDKERALYYYSEALPLWRSLGERSGEALSLTGIGKIDQDLGDYQGALDAYLQALPLIRLAKDPRGEGVIVNNIGLVYAALGENSKALPYFLQALPLRRKVGNRGGEVATLNSLGTLYSSEGDRQKALENFDQALTLSREIKNPGGEAVTLTRLGSLYDSFGDKPKAIDFQRQALEIRRRLGDRNGVAAVLTRLGLLHRSLGDGEAALSEYREALSTAQGTHYRELEAELLYRLAQVSRDRHDIVEARRLIEEGIGIIESLRAGVISADLRATYLATARSAFEFYVDLLMQMHQESPGKGLEALAFATNERARARSFLELLRGSRTEIRQGIDPTLLERERSARRRLNATLERQIRLLNGKHTEDQAAAISKEVQTASIERDQLEAEIRTSSPRYAKLTIPEPLTLSAIQRELVDDTLLLEYSLGEERSYVWMVTGAGISGHELPSRSRIEAAARHVYDLLTARNRREKSESASQRLARVHREDEEYPQAARSLSEMLLGPLGSRISGKRILVIADGALQYVPFAALPDPGSESVAGGWTPLVVNHEIVSLPSAAVLVALREELTGREPRSRTLAVFADPVFDKDDERVRSVTTSGKVASRSLTVTSREVGDERERDLFRSAADAGIPAGQDLKIPRLPYTRREARAILSLVPKTSRKEALDFDASLATATGTELAEYRFLHFATHGILDSTHPELSGIVLSLVDRAGRPISGFLPAVEVFNLRLPADMVVLSGCRTALGKEVRGEGLLGLTRGFLYAGTARVVASLWKVDDQATAELMARFYRGILGDKGLRPSSALQAAQISMWKQEQWKAPYYWSAFLLQGEWR